MKRLLMFWVLFVGLRLIGIAQEVIVEEMITDDDLKKFAKVEAMTAEFLLEKTDELKKMILANEEIKGGARFNEIKAAWGDDSKMAKAQVSAMEITAYEQILNFQGSLQKAVLDYKTELIKDDKVLGIVLYNKVNSAVEEDPALKEKLDQLIQDLKAKPSK
jgi:hypothetical protein